MSNYVFLGDVVKRVRNKVDKDNTDLVYYVGGEHFENGEVIISKKGIIKESTIGPAFNMSFEPGHVLLMSRNPHLRKAGVVDFSGICSNVSYVCETKDEEKLRQKFLPFIFQSEIFWRFAEANKKGSTNFFLNWSDFERFEFALPSIQEQDKLIELLWGANNTKEAYKKLLYITDELIKSQFIEMFGDPISNSKKWETDLLKNVAPEYAPTINDTELVWWLNLDMIEPNSGKLIERVMVPKNDVGNSTSTFDNTMVLYSKLRPYLNKVIVPDAEGYRTTELVGMKPDPSRINKVFLAYLLRSDQFVDFSNRISGGAQMPRMPMKVLREFNCILPPLELQYEFVTLTQNVNKSKVELQQNINNLDKTIKAIMAKNFG
ncbi:restriction endonuclease subunit S [Clostridium perfringens]|nr:restriction endonuclease subunit S [Clostridium perfringens]MDK0879523.1 restriction endonuclease subunit S [Clostridium perfringens]MDK0888379.1 restriction endonuclease subunit S [Clostridium perfringens]MDK0915211.1 restriction endonuclease subunit S [Clostridium perfringens]